VAVPVQVVAFPGECLVALGPSTVTPACTQEGHRRRRRRSTILPLRPRPTPPP